eukprot:CAMPEP_0169111566 /NCGR_PEP_ID=MMETSP1015-20121227/27146_1 /TAXON_ID=342587 /ORGANISM="Karlodinium micrum, Strain CCMP2283" /LENGTH=59 /DNA_ID=CAMNT_0009173497 /DNA_START=102 /DNA_END=281 /DNA_ORIENTATION=+
MHSRHEPLLDAEFLIDDFDDGCETIGGTRGARDNFHGGLVIICVDSNDDGWSVGVLGWR